MNKQSDSNAIKFYQADKYAVTEYSNGIRLIIDPATKCAHVVTPATTTVGEFSYPIKNYGDVFDVFRLHGASIRNIPSHCRAW